MSYPFTIVRHLHSGGNGDLYIGQWNDTGEYVVVKRLRESHITHARNAFAREVRILARGISGLVPVLFLDMNAQSPYYVMPYLAGGSLTAYAGRLTEVQLHNIATEVGLALAALHAAYVAHGDVKPDNILISTNGRLKVADPLGNGFGCTMLFHEHRGGTPGYWAPEVRAGGPISYAGDVYSYGAMLYHLLTGRRPQDGQRLDPGSENNLGAVKIRQIIAACCQADPHKRPSMGEVLRMLRGAEWTDIQVTRKQRQLLAGAVVVAGLILLAASAG